MDTQLLFYTQATPLNPEKHKDLYIKSGKDFSFAREVNSVPLTVAEFPMASAEYTIVFSGDDENVIPIVILGAQSEQNLYLNEDGTWRAQYVPAFVRRYPFVFAQGPDPKTLALCIDEQFSGCNHEGRGERLFDNEGQRTSFLDQVLNFQRAYQVQHQRTQRFCKKLVELDLLQSAQAQLNSGSGERRILRGLRLVDRAKLKALSAETLHGLMQSDELELIYLHLHSLSNLRVLGERLPGPVDDTAPQIETQPMPEGSADEVKH